MFTLTAKRSAALLLSALMILVIAAPAGRVSAAGNPNPGVIPPNANPYGHTYGEWSDMWWQWALSIPVPADDPESHPWFDQTGVNCGRDQSGSVFYLVGVVNESGTAVRNDCVVPPGKALFFPVLNVEWDTADGTPQDQLRTMVQGYMSSADESNMVAEVDGVPITNLANYRISKWESPRPYFEITIPDQNMYQYFGCTVCTEGRYTAVGDGYYLMLAPLSVGSHTVHFVGGFGDPYNFALDITYNLTVGH